MEYIKITHIDLLASYVIPKNWLDVVKDEIDESAVGDTWNIEIVEMTQDEFDNLPEFQGY